MKKSDLVLIVHVNSPGPSAWHKSFKTKETRRSLAMVLDTKGETSYVVYVAGRGDKVRHEPFWIDNDYLIPYGDYHGDESSR
jgi:hypothetical protein